MTDGTVVEIAVQAILLTTKLAAPILLVTLGIGVGIGLIQSVDSSPYSAPTSTASWLWLEYSVPRSHWMIAEFTGFTNNLFDQIPSLIRT